METNPIRQTVAEIIAYGTVGTLLDSAVEIIKEIDNDELESQLNQIADQVYSQFRVSESNLIELTATVGP